MKPALPAPKGMELETLEKEIHPILETETDKIPLDDFRKKAEFMMKHSRRSVNEQVSPPDEILPKTLRQKDKDNEKMVWVMKRTEYPRIPGEPIEEDRLEYGQVHEVPFRGEDLARELFYRYDEARVTALQVYWDRQKNAEKQEKSPKKSKAGKKKRR